MASIFFDNIPRTAQLNLTGIEVSQATRRRGLTIVPQRIALIGIADPAVLPPAAEGKPRPVFSPEEVASYAGAGSQGHAMARALFPNSGSVDVDFFPLLPSSTGTPLEAKITVILTGQITQPTTVAIYIAGDRVEVPIPKNAGANDIAASILSAVNSRSEVVLRAEVASAATTEVVLKSRWADQTANDITVEINTGQEESLPAGLTLAVEGVLVPDNGGGGDSGGSEPNATGSASLQKALDNFADDKVYTLIVHPFTDATNLQTLEDFETVRWHPRVARGFASVTAKREGAAETLASSRNSWVSAIVGQQSVPQLGAQVAAAVGGACARSAAGDPALQFHSLELRGLTVPNPDTHWSWERRDAAVRSGLSALRFANGRVVIDQMVNTYTRTSSGATTRPAVRFLNSVFVLIAITYDRQQYFKSVWPRAKLANDGGNFEGRGIMTPNTLKNEYVARYRLYARQGWVEDVEGYAKTINVNRPSSNPNRLDAEDEVILIGNLRILAMRIEYNFAS